MRFVVLGGGCYGSFYTRQLLRAADAGAIPRPEIVVVDHNENPQAKQFADDSRVRIVRNDWEPFFSEYFAALDENTDDQIVPPPFTPHLALSWLMRAVRDAKPGMDWQIEPFSALPVTPFVHHADIGTLTASHADWICPVHCIEPEQCPKTRGPRDWDMAVTARALAQRLEASGQKVAQVHLFQCLHFTHGVGTYPASAVVQAFRQIVDADQTGPQSFRVLVGTVSRCHGAMHLLKAAGGTDTVSPPHRESVRPSLTHPGPTNQ